MQQVRRTTDLHGYVVERMAACKSMFLLQRRETNEAYGWILVLQPCQEKDFSEVVDVM